MEAALFGSLTSGTSLGRLRHRSAELRPEHQRRRGLSPGRFQRRSGPIPDCRGTEGRQRQW